MTLLPKTKVCTTCNKRKPREKFSNKVTSKDGKKSYCKTCAAEKYRRYYQENTEQKRTYNKRYYQNNTEQMRERTRRYRRENAEQIREYKKRYTNKKYKESPNFRLTVNIRAHLHRAIKEGAIKNNSSIKYLGCSIEKLKEHLEKQFQPGMTWDNWSKDGWHIDHIKPLASFDLTDEKQLRKACHYTNLQPMWAKENLKKGARVA